MDEALEDKLESDIKLEKDHIVDGEPNDENKRVDEFKRTLNSKIHLLECVVCLEISLPPVVSLLYFNTYNFVK